MARGWTSRLWAATFVTVIAVAAAARIAGAANDLWLDEILAVRVAGHAPAAADVFTKLHSEINHHLYTLYLARLPADANFFDCRIPSLAAGIGAVVLAGLIGRRRSRACGLFAAILFGFSYVMILYSSEARGYALAVFFALAAFALLDRYLDTRRWPSAVGFSVCVVLGFLSQLTFASFYLAALAWSLYRVRTGFENLPSPFGRGAGGEGCMTRDGDIRPPSSALTLTLSQRERGPTSKPGLRREGKRRLLGAMLCCHAVPLLFLAAFYAVDIRHVTGIGGTPAALLRSCIDVPAWAIGSPSQVAAQVVACLAVAATLVAGIWLLRRERPDLGVFFLAAVLVFPVLLVAIRGSDVIYVRYFLVAAAFLLLLLSVVLDWLYQRGIGGKAACAALLALFVIANGLHTAKLFEYGRGQYRDAVSYMVKHSRQVPTTIGGDHDFRVAVVLAFYGLGDAYCPQNAWPQGGPEWLICHQESFEDPTPPAQQIVVGRDNQYELVKSFPSAPLSGLHWFLYHNRSR